jgi:signal transduction histidine kinase
LAPPAPVTTARAHPHDHLVGFYESDPFLAGSVARFLAPAFEGEAAAMVLATPSHLASFRRSLLDRGIDPASDRFLALDADEVLARISIDGQVDGDRFRAVVGELIDEQTRQGRRVYAFGELVALLWERGDVTGALELESLWNELATTRPFSLFCGYPTSAFADEEDTVAFRTVCDAHSAVIPSESYSELLDPADKLREVAILKQEAVAGANERDALRRTRAELQAALDERDEADRLQKQFTAMLVHDLRSPTVVVAGLLEVLLEHWDHLDPVEIREHLATASASASRMERLIDDMLAMARLESGRFRFDLQPLDLAATVRSVSAEVRKTTGRHVEVSAPAGLRPAYADAGRQEQVIDNLLSNAVKFSPGGVTVSVEIEDPGGDHLVVRVLDGGSGIAEEDLGRLFQPFSRLEHRSGPVRGTGLGLFITKALVEGQGGAVSVDSEVGVGTRVSYTVPVAGTL